MGCCVAAQLAITRAVVRTPDDVPMAEGLPHSPRAAECLWTLVPAVALALVLVLTWRSLPTTQPPRAEPRSVTSAP